MKFIVNILLIALWSLAQNVIPVSAACYYYLTSYYCYTDYYYTYSALYLSTGAVAGIAVGSFAGIVITIVIIVLLCKACAKNGQRGTVIQPVHTAPAHAFTTAYQSNIPGASQVGHPGASQVGYGMPNQQPPSYPKKI